MDIYILQVITQR